MGFQPFHTTKRSHLEGQPATDAHGNQLALDGRIDNYQDLRRELNLSAVDISDSQLVLAGFLRWGEDCFSRFIGDWAIALWSTADHLLYLARDHAGTRTLYFRNSSGRLQWSTYLEALVRDDATPSINEEYAACYLGSRPIRDLTPYAASEPCRHLTIW